MKRTHMIVPALIAWPHQHQNVEPRVIMSVATLHAPQQVLPEILTLHLQD
jgi:hypothetical protein